MDRRRGQRRRRGRGAPGPGAVALGSARGCGPGAGRASDEACAATAVGKSSRQAAAGGEETSLLISVVMSIASQMRVQLPLWGAFRRARRVSGSAQNGFYWALQLKLARVSCWLPALAIRLLSSVTCAPAQPVWDPKATQSLKLTPPACRITLTELGCNLRGNNA